MDKKKKPAHTCAPETMMMGYGYNPWWSEGSVKPPLFLTSTFLFQSAEEGEDHFKVAYGQKKSSKPAGLIYSRVNNPELEILENRLAAWENAEDAAVFSSGMAAISTMSLAMCKPGDQVIFGIPVYGGTSYLFENILPEFGIECIPVESGENFVESVLELKKQKKLQNLKMIYFETPANPTIIMTDIEKVVTKLKKRLSTKKREIIIAVDNTFMGPVFQKVLPHGADFSVYSATKFLGGHSDLIAGAVLGRKDLMDMVKGYRTILGSMATPFVSWMLMRSLETLKVRMEQQARNAEVMAKWLCEQPEVNYVLHPSLDNTREAQKEICQKQCCGNGSLISFEVKGGKRRAFDILNNVEHCKLAVSLGGTETLIEHPRTMTHSDVSPALQDRAGITPGMIRISLGLENVDDIIHDLDQAMKKARKIVADKKAARAAKKKKK